MWPTTRLDPKVACRRVTSWYCSAWCSDWQMNPEWGSLIPGLCHIMLVTSSMTIVRAKIDMNVPRKRKGFCSQHDKVQCIARFASPHLCTAQVK